MIDVHLIFNKIFLHIYNKCKQKLAKFRGYQKRKKCDIFTGQTREVLFNIRFPISVHTSYSHFNLIVPKNDLGNIK